jgi:radical SAM-linked protein
VPDAAHLVMGRVFALRSVRVLFEKKDRMKFVSHLDMNRFMNRMVRISGIPVWYSEGFNPHPYITFALPLSLGFESTYEIMDIRLNNDSYTNEQVYNALCSVMPDGINVIKTTDPVKNARDIAFAKFNINFENMDSDISDSLVNYLSRDEIITEKKSKKGKMNTINLAEFIHSFDVSDTSLNIILAAGGSKNLNPTLLMDTYESLTNSKLPSYNITRSMLYDNDMKIFE